MAFLALTLTAADPALQIQTFAGSANVGDLGPASRAVLFQPEGIAIDLNGNTFVSDAGDHRIRVIRPDGTITTVCGTGTPGFSGDNGPATEAQLNAPYGLAVDRRGNLYVADLGNARVRRISPAGTITTIAGGGSLKPSFETEGSPATVVQLKTPRNLLADLDGTVYVADFDGNAVYAISAVGSFRLFAGTGEPGAGPSNIEAIRSPLRAPAGMALHPQGGVLVVDSGNNRIRWVFRNDVRPYSEQLWPGGVPFASPTALVFDNNQNLYIASAGASVLRRTPSGIMETIPYPARDLALDANGALVLSARTQVLRWRATTGSLLSSTTLPQVVAGGMDQAFTGDEGPATQARLLFPSGVAFHPDGSMWIADERQHRIRRVNAAGTIATVAGTGVPGWSGDGLPAIKGQLNRPAAVAFSPDGSVAISDAGNGRIRAITKSGDIVTLADGLKDPQGIAYDRDGSLLIAEAGANRVIRLAGSRVITLISEELNTPQAVAVDSTGAILAADSGNNRIVRLEPGRRPVPIGSWKLEFPRGLLADAAGNLWVSDAANHRLLRWARPQGETEGTFTVVAGGNGPGLIGDGKLATEAQLQFPGGLGQNAAGRVCFADAGNHRIRCLDAADVNPVVPPAETNAITFSARHAATQEKAVLAPGLLVSLYGNFDQLNTPSVEVNGQPTEILFAGTQQINLRTPPNLDTTKPAQIVLLQEKTAIAKLDVPTAKSNPGLFPLPEKTFKRGEMVTLVLTGLGDRRLDGGQITIARLPTYVASFNQTSGDAVIVCQIPPGFYASGQHMVEFSWPDLRLAAVAVQIE